MIRLRKDCLFYFFTKRIERLMDCVPDDWGDGYEHVMIGCTVEAQKRCDLRLPVFRRLPVRHKSIIAAPLLGKIDISEYLDESIEEVSAGGESGPQARPCDFSWITDLRRQCVGKNVSFTFHQTGAVFIKDGKTYIIRRCYQHSQAKKAGVDFNAGRDSLTEAGAGTVMK